MSKRVRHLTLILVALGMLAVTFPRLPALASDMDAAAKALVKLDDDWSAAAATKDADRVASYYAENGIAYPPNAPAAVGRDAAKKVWATYFADPGFISISWKALHAEVSQSGDVGFTSGTYEFSYKGPDGKPRMEKGKYLCVWQKQPDGTWKATHDMWNADAK